MTPRPPDRETAEARGVVDVWAMPARMMGCGIERRSVSAVEMRGGGGEEVGIFVVLRGLRETRDGEKVARWQA